MSTIIRQPIGFMIVGFLPRSMFVYNSNLRDSSTIKVFKTLEEADAKAEELEKQSKRFVELKRIKKPIEYMIVAINGVIE